MSVTNGRCSFLAGFVFMFFYPSSNIRLVAGKLFRANVIVIDSGSIDRLPEAVNHLRGPRDVENGQSRISQIPQKHFSVDLADFAVPGPMRFRHFSHAGDELVVRSEEHTSNSSHLRHLV